MATIEDLAAKVGVSVATVSNVLNDKPNVGATMRQRVLRAAKQMGYRPHRAAQAMSKGRTRAIGLVLPDLTNPFFLQLVQPVQNTARALGLLVCLIDRGQRRLLRALALAGILLMAQPAAGAARPAHAPDTDTRRMVIFDQDAAGPAGSDMQSMLMLMQDRSIDLLGICVVTGDAWRDEEVSHTLRLLEIAHRTAIPVVPGAVFPLLNGRRRTQAWEGLYGKLFYDGAYMSRWPSENTVSWTPLHPARPYWVPPLPEGQPAIHAATDSAAAFMLRMVHEHPHRITIIAAGALTDLALAARLDPQFASLAKELVFMGGSFNPVPADNPFAQEYDNNPRQEFNMRFDPEAASIALHQPWPKITEVPVDATSPTLMSRRLLGEVAKGAAPFDPYLGRFGQVYPLWDETAVAVWLDPSLISRQKTLLVDVDTAFTANYGATLSWPVGAGPGLGERPVQVVFAVDVPKLDRLVVRLLSAPGPISPGRQRSRSIAAAHSL